VTLATVPLYEWDAIAGVGCDAIWLMGVWDRSPAGKGIANQNTVLLDAFHRTLPDFQLQDNIGSAYCIRRYVVDEALGGPDGLSAARRVLAARGVRLVLDFVPNHVAPDHPWVGQHPEYFLHGSEAERSAAPASFIESGGHTLACGRDPYFAPWPDVLQLNAFSSQLRGAARNTLREIAEQCDAVRCDMAMLMLNAVFARTWGLRAGAVPATEYWQELIAPIVAERPDFRFLAEAYWDLEWTLQQLGFHWCYDKRLYDRLRGNDAGAIRVHLGAAAAYQDRLLRFIENHDEPRAAAVFAAPKAMAAAVTGLTLPGARLIHDGQIQGRAVQLPVFLRREPFETPNPTTILFYRHLLAATRDDVFRHGHWRLCESSGWPDNGSCEYLLAWGWAQAADGPLRFLIVVNFSDVRSQGCVHLGCGMSGASWRLSDCLTDAVFERSGDELDERGLYVDLPPWGSHFLRISGSHA
jgi:hypothetical protein